MIRVSIRRGEETHLTLSGHAGYKAKGEDIVCAAVSALCCSLEGFLRELEGEGMARVTANVSGPGHMELSFRMLSPQAEGGWRLFLIGLHAIRNLYPACFE